MKKSIILINGCPFVYEDESDDLSHETIKPISENDARDAVLKVDELFRKCGIRYGLCFGTLLGAVREEGLIKGDEDVDVYTLDVDKLVENIPYLFENGLKLCRVHPVVYSFRLNNNCYVDVYFRENCDTFPWSLYCDKLYGKVIPSKLIREFKIVKFLGVECSCPKNPERLFEIWYGKDWRTPKKGHKFKYELASYYYAHGIKERLLNLFK